MATATNSTQPITVEQDVVVLTMTPEEAEAVIAVLGKVEGYTGAEVYRDRMNAVWRALYDLGIGGTYGCTNESSRHLSGHLYFASPG